MAFLNFGFQIARFFQKGFILLFCLFLLFLSGCTTTKPITYFRDVPDTITKKTVAAAGIFI